MRFICFAIAFGIFFSAHSQELLNKDSLLRLLPKTKEDSSKVLLLIQIGQQYEGSEPEKAKQFYRQSLDLSRKIGYRLGEIKFAANYTYVLNMQGHYDSSLQINLESVNVAKQLKDKEYIFKTLFNTGTSYRLLEDYESALKIYLEAYPLVVAFNDNELTGQALDIIQGLYTELKQYRKSINYGMQSIASLRKAENPVLLAMAISNLGMNYANLRNLDSALLCYREALALSQQAGDKYVESAAYLNIGDVYLKSFQFADIGEYYKKALVLSKELESFASQTIAYRGLAYYHLSRREYTLAQQYADSSLVLARQLHSKAEMQKTYTLLSNLAMSKQDLRQSEWYAMKATEMADSLLNETIQKNTVEMDKKYETALKDKQILLQKADILNKTTWNYLLIGSAVTILLLSLLSYRNYKHRQKLQQQRITELETEKQLAATEAVLKGEEQERTRLAKDLHDGLGGMLSGIKYSFSTMKGNLVMTPENAQAFERSMDMLDSSIREMRRVAHNMMPEALIKFGLDAALKDFCNDVNQTGALKVAYQSIGIAGLELEQTKSITIYRIVQELLNNTMKHAGATQALVQVIRNNGLITVTVEDDGKGFDSAILKQSKGIGWSNIQNRVEFLNGKWDVHSEPGEGTSVHIEMAA
jgi:two-component system, NarL family, sensor kinase